METTIMSPQDNHTGEVCMVDQERWAEIRRLRHDEQISIAEIGWRLDVDHKTVRRCQVCFGPLGLRVPVSPGVLPVS